MMTMMDKCANCDWPLHGTEPCENCGRDPKKTYKSDPDIEKVLSLVATLTMGDDASGEQWAAYNRVAEEYGYQPPE